MVNNILAINVIIQFWHKIMLNLIYCKNIVYFQPLLRFGNKINTVFDPFSTVHNTIHFNYLFISFVNEVIFLVKHSIPMRNVKKKIKYKQKRIHSQYSLFKGQDLL